MTWLINFRRTPIYVNICYNKTILDATDDRIRELEIMISLADIGGSLAHQARQEQKVGVVVGPGWPFLHSVCAWEPSSLDIF
jgi:hypothetical protein